MAIRCMAYIFLINNHIVFLKITMAEFSKSGFTVNEFTLQVEIRCFLYLCDGIYRIAKVLLLCNHNKLQCWPVGRS